MMNPSTKRDATTAASSASRTKKSKTIATLPSGIAIPQKHYFDPWNSSSTGHQRAENRLSGSTSWSQSRNFKLRDQYQSGRSGGRRIADTVGAGSENFGHDGRKENGGWERGASGLRGRGQISLQECLEGNAKEETRSADPFQRAESSDESDTEKMQRQQKEDYEFQRAVQASLQESHNLVPLDDLESIPPSHQPEANTQPIADALSEEGPEKQIFRNLVFYINGSTAPLVSDHRLKYLIALHGGSLTISLGRKTVTHIIIGNPHDHTSKGAGGALAGSKIQKEVQRMRGRGIKYVNAEWLLDSIAAGTRLSEGKYGNVKTGGAGQASVFDKFKTTKPGIKEPKEVNNDFEDFDVSDE